MKLAVHILTGEKVAIKVMNKKELGVSTCTVMHYLPCLEIHVNKRML